MATQRNLADLKEAYRLFAEGNPQGFVDIFSSDIELRYFGPADAIPWAGDFHGYQGVAEFFTRFTKVVGIFEYQPREFIAGGDKVVVLGTVRARGRDSGKPIDAHWAHVLTFRREQAVALHIYSDTAAVAAAIR